MQIPLWGSQTKYISQLYAYINIYIVLRKSQNHDNSKTIIK